MGDVLVVKDLKTAYKSRLGDYNHAVDGVSFTLQEGRTLGIAGESGCGKSTLALSLMGFYFPPLTYLSGVIQIEGRDIMTMPYEELRRTILGKELAYIPQAAMNALNPTKRVLNFVRDIIHEHCPEKSKEEAKQLLLERFQLLGLPERAMHAYPNELSGGMKQRAALIRTLALDPQLLLLDEPFSALDYQTRLMVSSDICQLIRKAGKTMIIVTHDLSEAISLADKVYVLSARPATIKTVLPIQLTLQDSSPLAARNAPEFPYYFKQLWEELTDET